VTGRRKSELDAAVEAIGARATGVQSDSSSLSDLNRLYERVKTEAGPDRRLVRQRRRRLDASLGVDQRWRDGSLSVVASMDYSRTLRETPRFTASRREPPSTFP
jgi:hypothetical protein